MRTLYASTLILLTALLLSACSRSPDTADARQALEAELTQARLDGLFKVDQVRKLHGMENDAGQYAMQVSYRLTAQSDLRDYSEQLRTDESIPAMDRFAAIMALGAVRLEYGSVSRGDRFQEERQLIFEHTDKGWQPVR